MQYDPQNAPAATAALPPRRQAPVDAELLYELLSERLLSDFPPDVWREVFIGPGYDSIHFDCRVVNFLAVAGLSGEWTKADLAAIARKHRAHVDSFKPPSTVAFPDARDALDLAVMLQRESGHSLRMALLTVPCTLATFRVDGCQGTLSLGAPAGNAANKANATPEGSMYVSGETYALIARSIDHRTHGAVVAKEMEDNLVTSATIMFPPAPRAALSTFAGLGLTHA